MRRTFVTLLTLFVLTLCVAAQQQPPAQQPPPFKSRVTVVPVDVRVMDRNGKPITGLTAADFTVTEDGVPQSIVHFSFQQLAAQQNVAAENPPLDFRKPLGETIAPQTRRIFLIVLGRGRQVGPVRGVEAARKFIKEKLLPQDQAALLAYNRATDFTTDHKRLDETLERYWKEHEWIEARLRQHFSGLAAVHASPDIPPHIQAKVDGIFKAPGAVASRTADATGIVDQAQLAEDQRRNRDVAMRAEIAAERIKAGMATPFDQMAIEDANLIGVDSFDEYVEKSFVTNEDLGNLYAGVRYLRMLDGEKHLVFITSTGLYLPRLEGANSLASLANDARVTIDIIHTFGTPPAQIMNARGRITMAPAFMGTFENATSRQIATLTGGQMSSVRTGDDFFNRLDSSTLAQYLLGYVPTNGNWDGKYRRIQVRVNRPGAQVLYRHGYVGRQETAPMDRQQYLMYTRIASALNMTRVIDDVALDLGEPAVKTVGDKQVLNVTLRILPGAVKLTKADGFYIGKLEAVSFCADRNRRVVGELWHTIDVKLTEENYQRFMREGVSAEMQMQLSGEPRHMKTVLYDYTGDRIGSAVREIRGK
jgi:VWFA-related protein